VILAGILYELAVNGWNIPTRQIATLANNPSLKDRVRTFKQSQMVKFGDSRVSKVFLNGCNRFILSRLNRGK
jgi:hypothetical protein